MLSAIFNHCLPRPQQLRGGSEPLGRVSTLNLALKCSRGLQCVILSRNECNVVSVLRLYSEGLVVGVGRKNLFSAPKLVSVCKCNGRGCQSEPGSNSRALCYLSAQLLALESRASGQTLLNRSHCLGLGHIEEEICI